MCRAIIIASDWSDCDLYCSHLIHEQNRIYENNVRRTAAFSRGLIGASVYVYELKTDFNVKKSFATYRDSIKVSGRNNKKIVANCYDMSFRVVLQCFSEFILATKPVRVYQQ